MKRAINKNYINKQHLQKKVPLSAADHLVGFNNTKEICFFPGLSQREN